MPLVATRKCLTKLQKRICRTPSLAASLEPLANRQNETGLSLFYRYYFGICSFLLPMILVALSLQLTDIF